MTCQLLFAPECFVTQIARRLHLLEDCVGRSQQKSECEQTKGSGGGFCRLIDELQQATVPKQPAAGATFSGKRENGELEPPSGSQEGGYHWKEEEGPTEQ